MTDTTPEDGGRAAFSIEVEDACNVISATAADSRDRLWCRAACEVLNIREIAELMLRFNELREELSVYEAEK